MEENSHKSKYAEILFSIDEENNKCVDCSKENPTKVSVNNGIIICEECAEKHNQLGTMISYVRDINDEFDEYLLNYFTLGGNSKFLKFLKEEKVDVSLPIEQKYNTKAVDFYRRNLKRKVQGEHLLTKNYENPNEFNVNTENVFPEFQNYQIKKEPGQSKLKQAKTFAGKIGGGLFSIGKKMYSGVKQGATYVGAKATVGAKFVGQKASQGANYVAKKAEPALKKGAVYVGHQVEGVYTNIKNKIVHKKEGEVKKEEDVKEGEKVGEKVEGGENKNEENKSDENKNDEKLEEKIDENLGVDVGNQQVVESAARIDLNEGNNQ